MTARQLYDLWKQPLNCIQLRAMGRAINAASPKVQRELLIRLNMTAMQAREHLSERIDAADRVALNAKEFDR